MSKRILSLILSLVLIASLLAVVPVSANTADFTFSLLANGEAETTVSLGDIVEVTLEITENSGLAIMDLHSMQNYICFDTEYFEYVSATGYTTESGTQIISACPVKILDEYDRIYVNRSSLTGTAVELPFTAVTIRLKTIKEGSTVVQNGYVELLNNGIQYTVKENDAIIHIGDSSNRRTLRFATNGGTTISPVHIVSGSVIDLSEYVPSRPGNSFQGWYLEPELINKVTSVTLNEDMTIYAKWKASTLNRNLTFVTNGGTEIPQVTAIEGSLIDLEVYNPVRAGYVFVGWYTEPEFINEVTSIVLNGHKTVYAKWLKNCTLTFDTNGGTAIDSIVLPEGSSVKLSAYKTIRDGYVLEGWYTEPAFVNSVTEIILTDDATLYAHWELSLPDQTLTFNVVGGTIIHPVTAPYGTTIDLTNYVTTRAGYTFAGWYSTSGFTEMVTDITLDSNKTVYAKWLWNYTLSFNTNGGSAIPHATFAAGTVVNLSVYTPMKSGYAFDGWYTNSALTNKVTSITINSNMAVYAKWSINIPAGGGASGGGGGGGSIIITPDLSINVKGSATSYLSNTDLITISLFKEGESNPRYTTTITGNSTNYSIANVAAGSYIMKVSKPNHAPCEYAAIVADNSVDVSVNLCPLGDVNNNGQVTTVDFSMANSHAKEVSLLSGYKLKCADVIGTDGTVTTADAMRINSHAKNVNHLW